MVAGVARPYPTCPYPSRPYPSRPTPAESDIGTHAVAVRVTDAGGAGQTQAWTVEVLGSPLRITSSPPLVAFVGQEYHYLPTLVDETGGTGPYLWDILGDLPKSLAIDTGDTGGGVVGGTGDIRWTPTREQVRTYEMILKVVDPSGHVGQQFFSVKVEEFQVAPRIVSTPVTRVPVQGLYLYDVDAADAGEREFLTYSLVGGPPGMVMDEVSGVVQWIPDVEGSFPVTVRVTDSTGLTDEQSFLVSVVPDTTAPVVTITASPERAAPMQPIVLSVNGTDDVFAMNFAITVDGFPLVLDGQNQTVFESDVAGVHVVRATARDPAGNVGEVTIFVGITDASDTTAPVVALTAPLEHTNRATDRTKGAFFDAQTSNSPCLVERARLARRPRSGRQACQVSSRERGSLAVGRGLEHS